MTAMNGSAGCSPAHLAATRAGLRRVAEHVLTSTLYAATGEIAIVPSPGGFRTPPFGADGRFLTVDGAELVPGGGGNPRRRAERRLAVAGTLRPRHHGPGDQLRCLTWRCPFHRSIHIRGPARWRAAGRAGILERPVRDRPHIPPDRHRGGRGRLLPRRPGGGSRPCPNQLYQEKTMKGPQDKVALVTGGSSGIGQAIAIRLGEEGANVAINYVGRPEGAISTKEAIEQGVEICMKKMSEAGGRPILVAADVSDVQAVEQMFDRVRSEYGRLDILINNAGIQSAEDSHELSAADFDKVLAVNLS